MIFLRDFFLEVALAQPQQVEVLPEARCHADPQQGLGLHLLCRKWMGWEMGGELGKGFEMRNEEWGVGGEHLWTWVAPEAE